MSAHGKGGTYHYYACTARQKYGPKACSAERLSRQKLEDAVLSQLTGMYRDGALIRDALSSAREQAREERLDERRRSIKAEIALTERSSQRYFEAFEQGRLSPERCEQRLARLQQRLDELREQQDELASEDSDAVPEPTTADLKAVADRLIGSSLPASPRRPRRCCGC
jgi:chromosome segregation ATPase